MLTLMLYADADAVADSDFADGCLTKSYFIKNQEHIAGERVLGSGFALGSRSRLQVVCVAPEALLISPDTLQLDIFCWRCNK